MVTMRRALLIAVTFFVMAIFASESEVVAFRATSYLQNGKFVKSYALFERALLASRKESDIQAEGRILIAMAQIRIQSLEYEFASQLISQVRESALDSNAMTALLLTRLSLLNAQEKYGDAVNLWEKRGKYLVDEAPDLLQGSLQCEVAIAYAGMNNKKQAEAKLDLADDSFSDDAPGKLDFARARVSQLLGENNADSLYAEALNFSIKGNNSYMSATILYYRGLCTKSVALANDYFVRSANAFELLGLPNNKRRSENLKRDIKE